MTHPARPLGRTRFETELTVRPDDIDMNRHVHASRYQDYVLAARFDQMARCYGMSMAEFEKAGLGWFVKTAHVQYKRALNLGDTFVVRTWVEAIERTEVRVCFEILRQGNGKLCCDGWFEYTMVNTRTGRAEPIPDWIADKYAV
jgi:acyl-CoA thioester hydrolase/thioesterase-3